VPPTPESRGCARKYFRLPDHKSGPGESKVPQHPHLSWVHERHLLFGLHQNALPTFVDLKAPRVARFFSYNAHEKTGENTFSPVSIPLAMFPASPSITFVPPYPGLPSLQSNTPNAAAACYIDGSRGAFDERRYPQLYNPRRPWIVLHDLLQSLSWDPAYCEVFNPTEYFMWNQPGNPSAGGRFMLSRLDFLFSKREEVEREFATRIDQLDPDCDMAFAQESFDMPFYDPLDWEDVIKWSTWGEGREALSNTLQYVSEVKTLNRWLALMDYLGTRPDTAKIPRTSFRYMGTWAPTITREEDWQWLIHCAVPVYIITRIPKSHVPANLLPGNPDGDERYRINSFDADHSFDPYWLIRHPRSPVEVPDTPLECGASYMPSSLLPVSGPTLSPSAKSNSSLLTWLSPIYRDRHIQRFEMSCLDSQAKQAKERAMLDTLFPFCPPHYRVLKADTDRHPLLDVLGSQSAKDNKITRYEEVYDAELDCYHPKRLGRKTSATKYLLETVSYRWVFADQKVEILSDYPFPGRDPSFGRIIDAEDEYDALEKPSLEPRRYYYADLSTNKPAKYAFTWEPYEDLADVPQLPTQCYDRQRPRDQPDTTVPFQPRDHYVRFFDDPVHDAFQEHRRLRGYPGDSMFERQPSLATFTRYEDELAKMKGRDARELESLRWRGEYVVLMEKAHGRLGDRSDAELRELATEMASRAETLRTKRELLDRYNVRKLFKAARGDDKLCPEAIAWHIEGGDSHAICYPIRISGLHGDVTSDHVFRVLHRFLRIHYHEVVVFSSYLEVDTTRTMEFGMRFCEDALYIRGLFHAVQADGRFLDVQFLSSMSGKIHAVECPPEIPENETRQPMDRLARIVALLATPGLTPELTTDAYRLERNLTTFIQQSGIASAGEIWELKSTERSPLQHGKLNSSNDISSR
jgi:hypothetical protein